MKITKAALASLAMICGGAAHAQYGPAPTPPPQTAPEPNPAQPAAMTGRPCRPYCRLLSKHRAAPTPNM